jgi:hypothetical protein
MLSQCRLCKKAYDKQQRKVTKIRKEENPELSPSSFDDDDEPLIEFVATREMLNEAIGAIGPMFQETLRAVNLKAQEMVRFYNTYFDLLLLCKK